MGQYSSGEAQETRETPQLTLDISIDREKYPYIHLKKSDLKKLGIKEPGIYKLTLKLNGEKQTIYINIKKPKKQKINLPTKHKDKTKATITNIEKYNLEKIIETIENFHRQGKIKFLLLNRDNKLYLKLDQFTITVYSYKIRIYNNVLRIEIDVQQGYNKIITLQIRLLDNKIELYYKKAKDDYLKILDIKSARDIAVLEYLSRDYRRNPIMHLSLTSLDREKELSDMLKLLEVNKFSFIRKVKRHQYIYEVYNINLTQKDKLVIDQFLDQTYRHFYKQRDAANMEREKLGLEIAKRFLRYQGFERIIEHPKNLTKSRFGIDMLAVKDGETYLFEVKATEPSYLGFALKRAPLEISNQSTNDKYRKEIEKIRPPVKYIGAIVVTYHYSWRYLNRYQLYFWVNKYGKEQDY